MAPDNIKLKTLLTVIASIALIEGAAIFFNNVSPPNPISLIGVVRFIEISAIIAVVMVLEKNLHSIGLGIPTIAAGIQKGLIWAVAFGLITGIIFLILHLSGINPIFFLHTRLPENKNGMIFLLIVGSIIGPVAEELFFRGVLYGFLRRWGITAAMVFTTVIFIIAHNNTGTIPVLQAAGGIIFAAAYEIEKSLMVPIIIHTLGNMAIFILPLVFR